MATSDTITGLPEDLQLELEKTARAQGRPVGEVLSEAVSAYLNERSWQNLIESGRNRTRDLVITEEDIPRLIAETRSELSR